MNIFKRLLGKKPKPKPLIEFSKWFVRVVVYIWIFGVVFGALVVSAELIASIVLTAISAAKSSYSSGINITVHIAEYFTYVGVPLATSGPSYLFAKAFLNGKKVDKGYDPNYDDKFNSSGNGGTA